MDIRKQARGLFASLGSPKVSLGLIVALALAGIFASFASPAGRSVWLDGQATSLWLQGQPLPIALTALFRALVAGLSLSVLVGFATGQNARLTPLDRWVRGGVVAAHLGLFVVALGNSVGQGLGYRGQVLVPRSGTVGTATLRDGASVALPFTLEHRLASDQGDVQLLARETGDGPANVYPFQQGDTVSFSGGLRLYPAGEVRRGARGALRVLDRSGRVLLDDLDVEEGAIVSVPGTGVKVQVTGLWGSRNDLGPTARLVVRNPARGPEVLLVYRALPGLDRARGGALVFQLTGFTPGCEYLRFWIVKDPGLPLAAAGGLLLFAGALTGLTGCRLSPLVLPDLRPHAARGPSHPDSLLPPLPRGRWRFTETAAGEVRAPERSDGGERCVQA